MNALMVEPLSPNIPTEIERDESLSDDDDVDEQINKHLYGFAFEEQNERK